MISQHAKNRGSHTAANHRPNCGAKGSRTPDLLNAIQALYQLSYGPGSRMQPYQRGFCSQDRSASKSVPIGCRAPRIIRSGALGQATQCTMESTATNRRFQVFKFGGTSVKSATRIRGAVDLVRSANAGHHKIVVVSALGGVTDRLLEAIEDATASRTCFGQVVQDMQERHMGVVRELVLPEDVAALQTRLHELWKDLEDRLQGIYLLGECTRRTKDAVMSLGERASAPIVAAAFRAAGEESHAIDARDLIRTDASFGEGAVDFDATTRRIRKVLRDRPQGQVDVVTGFIASTEDGQTTTLGRSGSDYTATIIGRALRAERVVIWTDVDGVLSADPRDVPEAFPLTRLSYMEAAEMAYFGARVLHPRTMRPVQEAQIPLYIKNSLNPKAAGTLITSDSRKVDLRVKAISTIRSVAVVMIEGGGMIGVRGIAARVFGELAKGDVNVLMIAQASSEQSICLVVREGDADKAVTTLRGEFRPELAQGDITNIFAIPSCAVVSAVGDHMRLHPGLAGRMFATLGRSRVNVLSIAQGAAETNISAVVRDEEVRRAVRALHESFPLARLRAHVCLIGPGRVGEELLKIIGAQHKNLLETIRMNLRVVGLANSSRMVWNADGIPTDVAMEQLKTGKPASLDWLVQQLGESRLERLIVVDTTASSAVAARYPDFLEMGLGIVTANKLANTRELPFYQKLQDIAYRREVAYRYETTIGAALPVLSTLRDLIRSGDKVRKIEGIFSGTLSYVFSSLDHNTPFSEVVRCAHSLGYTEPDPRDDLRGEDVARKLLLLGREMGFAVERSDLAVESLLPSGLENESVDDFLNKLAMMDGEWAVRVEAARRDNKRLRYVAQFDGEKLTVGVQAVDADSPFARVEGRNNIIAFHTDRYSDTPLIVQGPGAGLKVTAAGLLADLIKAAELMP